MCRTGFLSIIRSLSTVHTAIGISHTGFPDCLLTGSGWNILIPLASSQQNLYDIYHCCVYSEKLLMMDRGIVRNM